LGKVFELFQSLHELDSFISEPILLQDIAPPFLVKWIVAGFGETFQKIIMGRVLFHEGHHVRDCPAAWRSRQPFFCPQLLNLLYLSSKNFLDLS
jgi:hypothetical protein